MDNDNTQELAQTPAPNIQPPQQAVTPQNTTVAAPPAPSGHSNKFILWFVVVLVVIVLLSGGIYTFLSRQKAETSSSQPIVQATIKPQDTIDALDRDLSAVNVGDVDDNFSSVDQDLQQL